VADFEEDRKALYNFGVESLGGKDRVLALSGSRSSFEGIDNIFKSNSFLVATDEGNHNGLFPEVAVSFRLSTMAFLSLLLFER